MAKHTYGFFTGDSVALSIRMFCPAAAVVEYEQALRTCGDKREHEGARGFTDVYKNTR